KNTVSTLEKLARYNRKYLPGDISAKTTIRRLDKVTTGTAQWYCSRAIRKDMRNQDCHLCDTVSDHGLFTAATRYLNIKWHYENGWIDKIVTSIKARQTFLQKNGIDATCVPLGYHRLWGHKLDLTRDIDVLFIGRLRHDRRRKILEKCSKALKSHGTKMHIAENNCYGDERTRLLNRSKIVLDIMRVPWEMPVMRLLMSMSCGALVVSDWTQDPEPFRPEHIVQAESSQLADTIMYYLQNSRKRETIVNAAYNYVTKQLTLTQSISKIIEIANVVKSV
ncbi:MAG: glycosyltransferase family protein, partial [Planctomycetota bacterium]